MTTLEIANIIWLALQIAWSTLSKNFNLKCMKGNRVLFLSAVIVSHRVCVKQCKAFVYESGTVQMDGNECE